MSSYRLLARFLPSNLNISAGIPSGQQALWFFVFFVHVGPHPGLAGYLAMVFPDAAEWTGWTEWCLLSQPFRF